MKYFQRGAQSWREEEDGLPDLFWTRTMPAVVLVFVVFLAVAGVGFGVGLSRNAPPLLEKEYGTCLVGVSTYPPVSIDGKKFRHMCEED